MAYTHAGFFLQPSPITSYIFEGMNLMFSNILILGEEAIHERVLHKKYQCCQLSRFPVNLPRNLQPEITT